MLDAGGSVRPANPEAVEWLEIGAFDQRKRANTKTYQRILHEMFRLPAGEAPIVLRLDDAERAAARARLAAAGRREGRPLVGLNLGGGGRWRRKVWAEERVAAFCRAVQEKDAWDLLLLGGPSERDLLPRVAARLARPTLVSGCDLPLRDFAALLGCCDALVTGDTLALHVAAALGVPVVALFGPTSAAEIELYGRGAKIVSPAACCLCYRMACDREPDCMALIAEDTVLTAVADQVRGP